MMLSSVVFEPRHTKRWLIHANSKGSASLCTYEVFCLHTCVDLEEPAGTIGGST